MLLLTRIPKSPRKSPAPVTWQESRVMQHVSRFTSDSKPPPARCGPHWLGAIGSPHRLGAITGIDPHVLRREVAGPVARARSARVQVHHNGNMVC